MNHETNIMKKGLLLGGLWLLTCACSQDNGGGGKSNPPPPPVPIAMPGARPYYPQPGYPPQGAYPRPSNYPNQLQMQAPYAAYPNTDSMNLPKYGTIRKQQPQLPVVGVPCPPSSPRAHPAAYRTVISSTRNRTSEPIESNYTVSSPASENRRVIESRPVVQGRNTTPESVDPRDPTPSTAPPLVQSPLPETTAKSFSLNDPGNTQSSQRSALANEARELRLINIWYRFDTFSRQEDNGLNQYNNAQQTGKELKLQFRYQIPDADPKIDISVQKILKSKNQPILLLPSKMEAFFQIKKPKSVGLVAMLNV